ncbi:hypothetical protein DV515_00004750 [Chloebia gouldiae]|uniref:Uncharacterized protein n=1 Tax=Chloebia gouldiae TaxID=44316 RepID=A0A3L8SP17_CHLGU|nr:hypothetical protein DV515_00004750 [Chloebia gouldiae]
MSILGCKSRKEESTLENKKLSNIEQAVLNKTCFSSTPDSSWEEETRSAVSQEAACGALTGSNRGWQRYPAGCVRLLRGGSIYTGPHYRLDVLVERPALMYMAKIGAGQPKLAERAPRLGALRSGRVRSRLQSQAWRIWLSEMCHVLYIRR